MIYLQKLEIDLGIDHDPVSLLEAVKCDDFTK